MSMTKLLSDDFDKTPNKSTEPIVFLPDNTQKPAQESVDKNQLRVQKACFRVFVAITAVGILIFIGFFTTMFMLGMGPFASQYSHETGGNKHYKSRYRITIPSSSTIRGGELTEHIFASMSEAQKMTPIPENTLSIALNAFPPFPAEHILHIFAERLTVIRTPNRCYIRPMRKEMLRAYNNSYMNKLNEGIQMKDSLKGEITSEQFYANKMPGIIRNTLVMLWCEGVPAFKLVSRRPPTIQVSDWIPRTPSSPPHDLSVLASGDQSGEFFDGSGNGPRGSEVTDENEAGSGDDADYSPTGMSSTLTRKDRRRRNIPLSDAMHVDPEEVPTVNDAKSDDSSDCPVIDQLLEDFILSPVSEKSSSPKVKVTRDVIMEC